MRADPRRVTDTMAGPVNAAIVGVVVVAATALAACGSTTDPDPGAADALSGTLVVHAAASLGDAFDQLADEFTARHPDVAVRLNVAGSQALATQVLQGAPGGVFAAADREQLDRVADHLAGEGVDFAGNELVVVTPADNPAGITDLADLADDSVTVVLAAEAVPLGGYTREVLAAEGVTVSPASEELDARAVLTKVATGNADAGIVYATDPAVADVQVIELPEDVDVATTYTIAVLADQATLGRAFVELVRSPPGQQVLDAHGFGPP